MGWRKLDITIGNGNTFDLYPADVDMSVGDSMYSWDLAGTGMEGKVIRTNSYGGVLFDTSPALVDSLSYNYPDIRIKFRYWCARSGQDIHCYLYDGANFNAELISATNVAYHAGVLVDMVFEIPRILDYYEEPQLAIVDYNEVDYLYIGNLEIWINDPNYDGDDSGGGGESAPTAKERYEFAYTGHEESVTLPKGTYRITAYGGNGGSATSNNVTVDGGKGGKAEATITLEENTTLYISVGGNGVDGSSSSASAGGWNGGGSGASYNTRYFGGGGGGATHIALASGLLSSLENNKESIMLVAGGGGGSGVARRSTTDASFAKAIGGNASALNGESGTGTATTQCGGGGTQTAGGAKASASSSSTAGTFGQGGVGTYACGGGGYYGGGGGRTYCSGSSATRYAGGGGAGSGYFAMTLTDTSYEASTESAGMVVIVDITRYPNKIEIEGEVILDLTKSTVTAESILAGFKAFKSNGRLIEGLAIAGKEYEAGTVTIASNTTSGQEIRFANKHEIPPQICLFYHVSGNPTGSYNYVMNAFYVNPIADVPEEYRTGNSRYMGFYGGAAGNGTYSRGLCYNYSPDLNQTTSGSYLGGFTTDALSHATKAGYAPYKDSSNYWNSGTYHWVAIWL